MNATVSQFGSMPRFQLQSVEWYRGANLTNMSAVYEVWIEKTHKQTRSAMLYASVLAMLWTVPGVLQSQSPVKIHVLGPSKLALGLTEIGHSLLKTRYRELVAAIGAVFKYLKTGQFLDQDIISKPAIPSTSPSCTKRGMQGMRQTIAPSLYLPKCIRHCTNFCPCV